MYTVVGSVASRTFRVIWALEELGQEYTITNAPPQSAEAKLYNPTGKVPALLIDGEVITDSVAIIQYLADKHDGLGFQAGTLDRARQDSLTQMISDELDGALWTAARNTFVLPKDKRVPEIKETLRWEFARSVDALESRMGDGPYLMGEAFSVPDIVLVHCCGWARSAKFDYPKGKLSAYIKRVIQRPAYQRAHALRSA